MPLYKTITVNEETSLAIWKVEETEEQLWENIELTPHCQKRFDRMKSVLHRKAFLSGNFISITHSHNFTGIIVSTSEEVGIDIEMQRNKILRIAHKFTPFEEYKTLANTDAIVRKLTIVWGAKESLYKIYGNRGLSFLHHINVHDFMFDAKKTTAQIIFKGVLSNYKIRFLEFEEFTCVYATRD